MKKIRKSLLLVAMSLVMIISLIGCTSNKGTQDENTTIRLGVIHMLELIQHQFY